MSAKKIKTIGWLFLLGGAMMGCVGTPGPKGWLPKPNQALYDAYGAWLVVEYASAEGNAITEGEFIAKDLQTVYILNDTGLAKIPRTKITHVTLAVYKEQGLIRAWAIVGTLSSASHGFYAAISFPIWLVTGISNAAAESRSGIVKSSYIDWAEFEKFARFPQGIPEGIDLDTLQPKKRGKKQGQTKQD